MARVHTYSPADISVTICGHRITGVLSVALEWSAPPFKLVRGIRGQNTRVKNLDTSAILYLELLQTSMSNEVLFEIIRQDKVYGTGRLLVALSDTGGNFQMQSEQAFVLQFPNYEFTDDFTPRVWEIAMLEVKDQRIAGNNSPLADVFSEGAEYVGNLISQARTTVQEIFN